MNLPDIESTIFGPAAPPAPFVSMYETLMGPAFERLAPSVQAFHRLQGVHVLDGWVRTEAPASCLAHLFAVCLGTPTKQSEGVIRFELDAKQGDELWIRHFPLSTMKSRLRLIEGTLTECLGITRLSFGLDEVDGVLVMRRTGCAALASRARAGPCLE
jgi:hypothetical protein